MRVLGLEVTESTLRAVVLDHGKQGASIRGFHEKIIPATGDAWADRAGPALKELLAEAKVGPVETAVALDSADVHLRILSLPFKTEDQIRKTIKFELEAHLSQFSAEDIVVDFHKIGETEKTATALTAAVPKELLGERLKGLQAAGIDPAIVDLDLHAIYRALLVSGLEEEEPVLIVHATPRFAKLLVVDGSLVRMARTIRFSLGEPAPQSAAAAPSKGAPAARSAGAAASTQRRTETDLSLRDLSQQSRTALLHHLGKEVQRFLLAAGADAPGKMVLSGEVDDDAVAQALSARTKLPVVRVDPFEALDSALAGGKARQEVRRKIVPALGAALRLLDPEARDAPGFNFRQEELVYVRRISEVAGTALVTLQLLLVLVAAFGVKFFLDARRQAAGREAVLAETREVVGLYVARVEEGEDIEARTVQWYQEEQARRGLAGFPIRYTAADLLGYFYAAVSQYQAQRSRLPDYYLALVAVRVTAEQRQLTGTYRTRTDQEAYALRDLLKLQEAFDQVTVTASPMREGGLYEASFTITTK